MSDKKQRFLEKLAKGNPVDLEKVRSVDDQLTELAKAGVLQRPADIVIRPLGRHVHASRTQLLAENRVMTKAAQK